MSTSAAASNVPISQAQKATSTGGARGSGATDGSSTQLTQQQPQQRGLGSSELSFPSVLAPFEQMLSDPFALSFPGMGGGFGQLMAPLSNMQSELARVQQALPSLKLDIIEQPDKFLVKADVPGVKKEDVRIEVDSRNNLLYLSTDMNKSNEERREEAGYRIHKVERQSGYQQRTVRLPANANLESIAANIDNGVLSVNIPKREGVEASGRRRVTIA